MATNTYNLGRVVGWSAYEEFLLENPSVDPTIITAQIYQTMVTYGVTRRVELPTAGWSGDVILKQTVEVPGAIWGVTPIIGIDYEYYEYLTKDEIDSVTGKTSVERIVSNVFSCYTSDAEGNKVINTTSSSGYITFCAYPELLEEVSRDSIFLIVRGLGMDGAVDGNFYLGPQGLLFAGNGFGNKGAAGNYKRELPDSSESQRVDMDPVIDMRTTDPKTFYQGNYSDSPVAIEVNEIQTLNKDAGILSVYQKSQNVAPALFGTKLGKGEVGVNKVNPIDTVAPGTVKVFHDKDREYLQAFEEALPNNVGTFRDALEYVWYQLNQSGMTVPVSNDTYTPLQGSLRSEEILCPILAVQLNQTDPHDYLNINGNRRLYGYLGTDFIDKYCLSETEINNIFRTATLVGSGWSSVTRDNYKTSVLDVSDNYTYKYLLYSNSPGTSAGYWEVIPIRITLDKNGNEIGYLDMTTKYYCSGTPREWDYDAVDYTDRGINPPEDWIVNPLIPLPRTTDPKTPLVTNHALVGSWWDNSVPANLESGEATEFRSNHPTTASLVDTLLENVEGIKLVQTPTRRMPSATYNGVTYDTYIDMYKNVTLKDVELNGGDKRLRDWLHPSLRGDDVTIYDLVDKARIYKITPNGQDELTPLTSIVDGKQVIGHGLNFYCISREAVQEATVRADTLVNYGTTIAIKNLKENKDQEGDIIPEAELTSSDKVVIFTDIQSKGSVNFITYLSEDNAYKTVLVDVPSNYRLKNSPQATLGESGNNQALGLAVCKEDGTLCNIWGTDGVATQKTSMDGNLTWDLLAQALYDGEAIDLLGSVLKKLRQHRYLELNDGTRVYFATSPPADAPDGSIGIGW